MVRLGISDQVHELDGTPDRSDDGQGDFDPLAGQIHHARRDAAKAIECYEKVSEQFADAREALQGIRERQLALPEVTLARPGQGAAVAVVSRNLKQAELLVYPVDLMTLCLREKNLSSIANVNLAGIAPVIRRTVELGETSPFLASETSVKLELPKAGAYLVPSDVTVAALIPTSSSPRFAVARTASSTPRSNSTSVALSSPLMPLTMLWASACARDQWLP